MNITLWTTSETQSVSDSYKSWKTRVSLNFNQGVYLSIDEVWTGYNNKEYTGGGHTSFGIDWAFEFGYFCHQYDGFWKRISFGPLFISWYSPTE